MFVTEIHEPDTLVFFFFFNLPNIVKSIITLKFIAHIISVLPTQEGYIKYKLEKLKPLQL